MPIKSVVTNRLGSNGIVRREVRKNDGSKRLSRRVVREAAHAKTPDRIVIAPLNMMQMRIPIRSTSGLLYNRFREDAIAAMRSKAETGVKVRTATRNLDKECLGTLHVIGARPSTIAESKSATYGFPASGFKGSLMEAAKDAGVHSTIIGRCLFVEGDHHNLVKITPDGARGAFEHVWTTQRPKSAGVSSRYLLDEWSAVLTIRFDADRISQEALLQLVIRAGVFIGIASWRLWNGHTCGSFGGWEVIQNKIRVTQLLGIGLAPRRASR